MGDSPVVDLRLPEDGGAPTWTVSFPAMGTRIDLIGHGGRLADITDVSCALVSELESLWSVFRADSDVSRLNASSTWCEVDARTDALLADALAFAAASDGAFTPLAGALVRLWDVKGARRVFVESGRVPPPPSDEECLRAALACDARFLRRDGVGRWRLEEAGRSDIGEDEPVPGSCPRGPLLDLGGIAKGATADAVRDAVVAAGAEGVLVSVGTSSIAVYGSRTDATPWRVGLREPGGTENALVGRVALQDGALSTSGDYVPSSPLGVAGGAGASWALRDHPRFGHHILNSKTGRPTASRVRQATVMCQSGVMAEALSTALIVSGAQCVDEEIVAAWARERGVSGRWESVVMGEEGVVASPGSGWVTRPRPN